MAQHDPPQDPRPGPIAPGHGSRDTLAPPAELAVDLDLLALQFGFVPPQRSIAVHGATDPRAS